MKILRASVWLRNREDKIFEIPNTSKIFLELAENHKILSCNASDLIIYIPFPKPFLQSHWEVVHRSKGKEEAELIKATVYKMLHVKSQKLKQRQVLKKMKNPAVTQLINDIDKDLRTLFFELSIDEILNGTIAERTTV